MAKTISKKRVNVLFESVSCMRSSLSGLARMLDVFLEAPGATEGGNAAVAALPALLRGLF
eukprot:1221769-Amphidinium_carterae.1